MYTPSNQPRNSFIRFNSLTSSYRMSYPGWDISFCARTDLGPYESGYAAEHGRYPPQSDISLASSGRTYGRILSTSEVRLCNQTQHPQVQEAWSSAEFYSNKILKDFRESELPHVSWARQLKDCIMKLKAFVSRFFPGSNGWQASGQSLKQSLGECTHARECNPITLHSRQDASSVPVIHPGPEE